MTRSMLLLSLLATVTLAADVEYSTTGAMNTPATMGGDRDGWGTEFVAMWENTTGSGVLIEEFGWPCGGWWAQFWYVWITDALPADPYTLEYYDSFVPTSEDDTEWPPSVYSYIDVHDQGIVVPVGATMVFGYGNPGMGGHIGFNGVETWAWLDDSWDLDGDYNRTAVLQFRGSFVATPVENLPAPGLRLAGHPNPFNPSTTLSLTLPRDMNAEVTVYSLHGRPVKGILRGNRSEGTHQVVWDGTDDRGAAVPSGLYIVKAATPMGSVACKVMLTK